MGPRKAPLVALALLGSAAAFASISEDGEFKVSADFALDVMKELGCDPFLENPNYKSVRDASGLGCPLVRCSSQTPSRTGRVSRARTLSTTPMATAC